MKAHATALIAAAAIVVSGIAFAPATALADCSGPAHPRSVSDVQGTTFVGVFISTTPQNRVHTWTVEHVYAGDVSVGELTYGAGSCSQSEFTPGVRYLVSWGRSPSAWYTAAYRVLARGRLQLVPFHDVRPELFPEALQVTTTRDALAVLLLPPTDRAPSGSGLVAQLVAVFLSFGLLFAVGLTRRLRSMPRDTERAG
jgi:hypothetical protein